MPLIAMFGPHAVGKTTALSRYKARYGDRLITLSFDAERSAFPGNPEKQSKVRQCQSDPAVWLLESARGFAGWLSVFGPSDPVIVLTCPEPVGRRWLVERRRGKPLTDYWTGKRLDYECNGHLLNWVSRLPGARHFVVEDRERDWVKVDEYFGKLFRELHNRLNRKRG
jgi:hypothetical protein